MCGNYWAFGANLRTILFPIPKPQNICQIRCERGQTDTVTLHQPQLAMPQGAGVGPSLLDALSPLPYAVSPAREVFTMGGDTTTSPYHAN